MSLYLAEPPPLTAAQQSLHTTSAALLRELRGLRTLARDLDAAREDVESEREVLASFTAEELIDHLIGATEDQLDAAGMMVPPVRRAA
jgi:hypothetical protein